MYAEPGTADARHFCGVMLRELSLNASDVFAQHYTLVLPQVFVSQYDEESEVASLFTDIWESCTTKSAAMRLYMPEILPLVTEGLKNQSWPCKASRPLPQL
jgi:hypothetical protein